MTAYVSTFRHHRGGSAVDAWVMRSELARKKRENDRPKDEIQQRRNLSRRCSESPSGFTVSESPRIASYGLEADARRSRGTGITGMNRARWDLYKPTLSAQLTKELLTLFDLSRVRYRTDRVARDRFGLF